MKQKKKILYIVCFFLLPVLVGIMELQKSSIEETYTIERNKPLEGEKQVEIYLNAEGILENYIYQLNITEALYTKEEIEGYFAETIMQINQDFENVTDSVPIQDTYIEDIVEAEWRFSPYGYIDTNNHIIQENISEEGILMHASVTLCCGKYEQIYTFPFYIHQAKRSEKEQLLLELSNWFEVEMQKEGEIKVHLPTEIKGVILSWKEKPTYLFWKIIIFEIVIAVLLYFVKREKQEEKEKTLYLLMEQDYPEIVGSLAVLLGAGMTLKQAWNYLALQYVQKKEKNMIIQRPAYEELVLANYRMKEGENEKSAFSKFAENIPNLSYHKLVRILLGNLQKGTSGLCETLDKETEDAYERRVLQARKKGEEASSKMLVPMMIMMVIVMAIVIRCSF